MLQVHSTRYSGSLIISLCALRRGHDQGVVDYVGLCHPGLKEQISNLSFVLRGIVASELPPKRLVIETIPDHDLSDHPFEELFQFSNDRNLSKLGDPPSEEPSQMSREDVDARQNDTAVSPSDPTQANKRVRGTIESVQVMHPDCTSESLRLRSFSTEIKNKNLLNFIIQLKAFFK